MLEIQELEIIAQLINSMEAGVKKLEDAYSDKNKDKFSKLKDEILNFQNKIDKSIK